DARDRTATQRGAAFRLHDAAQAGGRDGAGRRGEDRGLTCAGGPGGQPFSATAAQRQLRRRPSACSIACAKARISNGITSSFKRYSCRIGATLETSIRHLLAALLT